MALLLACVLPGSALADAPTVVLSDPAEQVCLPHSICLPDIVGASASFDPTAGTVAVSVTFVRTLPPQSDPSAPGDEIRFVLGHAVSNGHCTNITSSDLATGLAQGDLDLRGYVSGSVVNQEWAVARLAIGGTPASTVPRVLSADDKTLQYTVSSPALVGSDFRCFEVSETQFNPSAQVDDGTQYALFPGVQPLAEISSVAVRRIAATSASVVASIDPDGAPTSAYLEFGTTTHYGRRTSAGNPLSAVGPFASDLTGLKAGTTYHYRIVATSAFGSTSTTDASFRTTPVATATSAPRLVGSLKTGSLARCTRGTWSIPVKVSSYRWLRGGVPIPGAAASSYRIRSSDAGHTVRCAVVVTVAAKKSTQAVSPARKVSA